MIKLDQQVFVPVENESVLDCLLRHGIEAPHSCRNGVCQTCVMRAIDGSLPVNSQKGLKESQVAQKYFLACVCYPETEIEVAFTDTQISRYPVKILEKTRLSSSVLQLRFTRPENFTYYAGQFLTVFKNNSLGRSYSLSSAPGMHDHLEIQINVFPNGKVSSWLSDTVNEGDELTIGEPMGNCIYIGAAKTRPMLLIGTGTGIAPLAGIVQQAISEKHEQPIHIYHGSRSMDGLYLQQFLTDLASKHPQVHYYPSVSRESPKPGIRQGRASDLALADKHELKNFSVYLCGNPDMVNNAKRQIFLAGASLQHIHSDPFVHS